MAVRPPTNPGMSRMPEDLFEKRLLWGMGASLCANFLAGIVVSSAIGRMKMPGESALPSLNTIDLKILDELPKVAPKPDKLATTPMPLSTPPPLRTAEVPTPSPFATPAPQLPTAPPIEELKKLVAKERQNMPPVFVPAPKPIEPVTIKTPPTPAPRPQPTPIAVAMNNAATPPPVRLKPANPTLPVRENTPIDPDVPINPNAFRRTAPSMARSPLSPNPNTSASANARKVAASTNPTNAPDPTNASNALSTGRTNRRNRNLVDEGGGMNSASSGRLTERGSGNATPAELAEGSAVAGTRRAATGGRGVGETSVGAAGGRARASLTPSGQPDLTISPADATGGRFSRSRNNRNGGLADSATSLGAGTFTERAGGGANAGMEVTPGAAAAAKRIAAAGGITESAVGGASVGGRRAATSGAPGANAELLPTGSAGVSGARARRSGATMADSSSGMGPGSFAERTRGAGATADDATLPGATPGGIASRNRTVADSGVGTAGSRSRSFSAGAPTASEILLNKSNPDFVSRRGPAVGRTALVDSSMAIMTGTLRERGGDPGLAAVEGAPDTVPNRIAPGRLSVRETGTGSATPGGRRVGTGSRAGIAAEVAMGNSGGGSLGRSARAARSAGGLAESAGGFSGGAMREKSGGGSAGGDVSAPGAGGGAIRVASGARTISEGGAGSATSRGGRKLGNFDASAGANVDLSNGGGGGARGVKKSAGGGMAQKLGGGDLSAMGEGARRSGGTSGDGDEPGTAARGNAKKAGKGGGVNDGSPISARGGSGKGVKSGGGGAGSDTGPDEGDGDGKLAGDGRRGKGSREGELADGGNAGRAPRAARDARPLSDPNPKLTDEMKQRKLNAKIVVSVEVDVDGSHSESIVTGSGDDEVDALILKTMRRWRWANAIVDGEPKKQTIRYRFTIDVK